MHRHKKNEKRGVLRRLFSRRNGIVLLIIIVVLIGLRLALPYAIKKYVNRQLSKNPDYAGHVNDIDVHLYRGAYQIRGVKIVKTTGDVPAPLFSARVIDLSVEWKELRHGSMVGEIVMDDPQVHIVAAPTQQDSQTGEEADWTQTIKSLFPFKINRMEVRKGMVHFQNFHSDPQVDIYVNNLSAVATNLTNKRDVKQPLPAGLTATGTTVGGGGLDLQLQMNPLEHVPTFELTAQLTNVDLVAMNDFLKAYGKFDVERGRFALYTSCAASEGKYEGYAKVFFDNLDVFAWEKERKKNILQIFWQAIVGGVSTVLRNHPKDQLATKIPFSGSYEGKNVGVLPAVGTLLRNAFISALVPKLDQSITVEEVKEKPPGNPSPTEKQKPAKETEKENAPSPPKP